MDTLTVDDQIYLSSKRAAEVTGYAKDYIGQLCREGRVKARLVGRSWYVLESSIRAHRFGSEETKEEATRDASPVAETWTAPVYKKEEAHTLPPLQKREEGQRTAAPAPITDMEAVWKEWFDSRKNSEEVLADILELEESPQDEIEDEERVPDESVPVRRIETVFEPMEAHQEEEAHERAFTEVEEEYEDQQPARSMPTLIIRSLAVAAAVLVLGSTVIAHGFFDAFSRASGITASVVDFLDGTSVYKDK